ncbi:hypothetical protein HMPREF0653_01042 [Prevotella disiens JCM 6334 = ATCC 29426]|uniref:Uncharacterized protein n=1 Tax=Prevotella disiens JCM 6334 = ATCC 29426 TaxID=1235811 RepID=A0ABN0NT48_9BACT|nr:hypothetical protein HMPREF0653_01042 [Prevotella disiens JCM 6334 = ATCC 29426]
MESFFYIAKILKIYELAKHSLIIYVNFLYYTDFVEHCRFYQAKKQL